MYNAKIQITNRKVCVAHFIINWNNWKMKKETKQKIWKWHIETIQMFSMLNLPAWILATDLMSKISLWTNEWHSPIYRIIYMRWLIINVWRRHLSYHSWRKHISRVSRVSSGLSTLSSQHDIMSSMSKAQIAFVTFYCS